MNVPENAWQDMRTEIKNKTLNVFGSLQICNHFCLTHMMAKDGEGDGKRY